MCTVGGSTWCWLSRGPCIVVGATSGWTGGQGAGVCAPQSPPTVSPVAAGLCRHRVGAIACVLRVVRPSVLS
eukprot:6713934-Prorocentrum_lima.AAC.1